jgi:D-tyrosyl-tRNA(Tyr) deacylase
MFFGKTSVGSGASNSMGVLLPKIFHWARCALSHRARRGGPRHVSQCPRPSAPALLSRHRSVMAQHGHSLSWCMRVLLQRVSRAEVRVREGEAVRMTGRIGRGFLLLVGFTHDDEETRVAWMAEKIVGLRLFADAEEKMNLALADVGGELLVVSQFTLYGDAAKGRRPSFIDAARPETAIPLYERFVALLRERSVTVATGEFGAMMDVELVNDGPVTLWLER